MYLSISLQRLILLGSAIAFGFGVLFAPTVVAYAATLSITPDTAVHSAGATFTVRVLVNTQGETINAADGTISFNPNELTVVSVSESGSIFNLWAEEPSVSGGQITFSGGAPSGYSGSSGTLFTITMRATGSGTARLSWQGGSVLAADGRGSNVLSNMHGASYTVNAERSEPTPERVEYVAPANTPSAPAIESATHPDPDGWYQATDATLSWSVPTGVTEVRTAVNRDPNAVPSTVADGTISSLSAADLPEGVSYAHVQFRNADGWGTIGRYRLAVSTEDPSGVAVALPEDADLTMPTQTLAVSVASSTAPITRALVQIDGGDPIEYELSGATSTIELPELEAGYHSFVVEVQDAAGNGSIVTLSFTIESFSAPTFKDVPAQISEGVLPVFEGDTRPDSTVTATIRALGNDSVREYEVQSDAEGHFRVIPDTPLAAGAYELSAVATDTFGAVSERSEAHRFVIQPPGYVEIGAMLVNVLSIIIPLVAMVVLLGVFGWYVVHRIRRLRGRVRRESAEAHEQLTTEFTTLRALLDEQETALAASRKTKRLTKAEQELLDTLREHLEQSEQRVAKEVADVEELVPGKRAAKHRTTS